MGKVRNIVSQIVHTLAEVLGYCILVFSLYSGFLLTLEKVQLGFELYNPPMRVAQKLK